MKGKMRAIVFIIVIIITASLARALSLLWFGGGRLGIG